MQPRHEIKFHISPLGADALSRRLAAVLQRDAHANPHTGEYTIRSLYFDDAWDSAFHEKLDGVQNRDKYRIRVYKTKNSPISMERKRKMGNLIQKDSVRITQRLAQQLMRANPTGLESIGKPLLTDVGIQMRTKLLRPAVLVEYDREAFTYPIEDVRVTIDKRIRTGLVHTNLFQEDFQTVEVLDRNTWILEIKFNDYLPDFIASLLVGIPTERSAISKYTLCRRFEPQL